LLADVVFLDVNTGMGSSILVDTCGMLLGGSNLISISMEDPSNIYPVDGWNV